MFMLAVGLSFIAIAESRKAFLANGNGFGNQGSGGSGGGNVLPTGQTIFVPGASLPVANNLPLNNLHAPGLSIGNAGNAAVVGNGVAPQMPVAQQLPNITASIAALAAAHQAATTGDGTAASGNLSTEAASHMCRVVQSMVGNNQLLPTIFLMALSYYLGSGGDYRTLLEKAQEYAPHISVALTLSGLYSASNVKDPKDTAMTQQFKELQASVEKLKLLRYQIQQWQAYANQWQKLPISAPQASGVNNFAPSNIVGPQSLSAVPQQLPEQSPAVVVPQIISSQTQPVLQPPAFAGGAPTGGGNGNAPGTGTSTPPSDAGAQNLPSTVNGGQNQWSAANRLDIERIRMQLASGQLNLEDVVASDPIVPSVPVPQFVGGIGGTPKVPSARPPSTAGIPISAQQGVPLAPGQAPSMMPAFLSNPHGGQPSGPGVPPPQPQFAVQSRGIGALGGVAEQAPANSGGMQNVTITLETITGNTASTPLLHKMKAECSSCAKDKTRALLKKQQQLVLSLLEAHDALAKSTGDKYNLYLSLLEEDKTRVRTELLNAALLERRKNTWSTSSPVQPRPRSRAMRLVSAPESSSSSFFGTICPKGRQSCTTRNVDHEQLLDTTDSTPTSSSPAAQKHDQNEDEEQQGRGEVETQFFIEDHESNSFGAGSSSGSENELSEEEIKTQLVMNALEAGEVGGPSLDLAEEKVKLHQSKSDQMNYSGSASCCSSRYLSSCIPEKVRAVFRKVFCCGSSSLLTRCCSCFKTQLPQSAEELSQRLYEGADDSRLWLGQRSALTAIAHHRVNLAMHQLQAAEKELEE
ncbi:unnamed protein product [Amoebophrya sp. A25]|nr:unnamed protein product [Amoebophrya sp. A25]|eukprot:GSA25T00009914001.1